MKKEDQTVVIQSPEIILQDKVKQREEIRKEFLEEKKERYKNKETTPNLKKDKKQIIAQLKEVYQDG